MHQELILSKKYYALECIKEAIEDFSGFAFFSIEEDPGYYKINLEAVDEAENVEMEFGNYVLGLMKNMGYV